MTIRMTLGIAGLAIVGGVLAWTAMAQEQTGLAALQARADALADKIERLEDEREIQNLQRSYGFFVDKSLWRDIAGLFAEDGTLEIGGRGVFLGPERVYEYMRFLSKEGPQPGLLANHMQLQPVITVAEDGQTAQGRWHFIAMGGESGDAGKAGLPDFGYLGEGYYENAYVKEDGVWKIDELHGIFRMYTIDTDGWAKTALPLTKPEADLPPDMPPSLDYEMYPSTFIPDYHYAHPVTGEAVSAN